MRTCDREFTPEQGVEQADQRHERTAAQPKRENDQQGGTGSPAPTPEAANRLAKKAEGHVSWPSSLPPIVNVLPGDVTSNSVRTESLANLFTGVAEST